MNLLGLDIGEKRIGVALGETTTRLAVPVRVLERESFERDVEHLQALAREYDAEQIVAGLPLRVDGTEGEQARRVRQFVTRLRARLGIPLEFFDERYSTVEAMNAQRDAGHTTRTGRATVDASAAAILLQAYLDAAPRASSE